MKLLAIEREVPGVADAAFTQERLREEAAKAWELYQAGTIRELYFRSDWPGVVLVLECAGVEEAQAALGQLPLVRARLIAFEVLPLGPYPGFARLFA